MVPVPRVRAFYCQQNSHNVSGILEGSRTEPHSMDCLKERAEVTGMVNTRTRSKYLGCGSVRTQQNTTLEKISHIHKRKGKDVRRAPQSFGSCPTDVPSCCCPREPAVFPFCGLCRRSLPLPHNMLSPSPNLPYEFKPSTAYRAF